MIIFLILSLGAYLFISKANKNLEELKNAKITQINLTELSDGTYTGVYKVSPVSAKVKVTILNHKITDILLEEHKNGQGKPAEVITNKVIEAQSLEVDTISGATYSSIVILKAIENALVK